MITGELLAAIKAVAAGPRPVVLIDGGAGAGKSTLAQRLVNDWPSDPPQLVGLDEFYPGWDGLAAAAGLVPQLISGTGFRSWDWASGNPGQWRELDPTRGLIIEGCGAITPASRTLAGLTLWLEAPLPVRRQRALARDGATFAPHWDQWASQEAEHWRRDRPQELADLVIKAD